MPEPSHAAVRYREAVQQIGERLKFARGWKTAAAKILGVHPSYVSKVSNGEVTQVGTDIIERAIAAGFDRDFFAVDLQRENRPTIKQVADGLREQRGLSGEPADLSWMMGEAVRLASIINVAPPGSALAAALEEPMVGELGNSPLFRSIVPRLGDMFRRDDHRVDADPLVRELAAIVLDFEAVVSRSPAVSELAAIRDRVHSLMVRTGELRNRHMEQLAARMEAPKPE